MTIALIMETKLIHECKICKKLFSDFQLITIIEGSPSDLKFACPTCKNNIFNLNNKYKQSRNRASRIMIKP